VAIGSDVLGSRSVSMLPIKAKQSFGGSVYRIPLTKHYNGVILVGQDGDLNK
jgi:hypothetical protein